MSLQLLHAWSPKQKGQWVLASSACSWLLSTRGDFQRLREGTWVPVEKFTCSLLDLTGQPHQASVCEALPRQPLCPGDAFSSASDPASWLMSQRATGVNSSSPRPRIRLSSYISCRVSLAGLPGFVSAHWAVLRAYFRKRCKLKWAVTLSSIDPPGSMTVGLNEAETVITKSRMKSCPSAW